MKLKCLIFLTALVAMTVTLLGQDNNLKQVDSFISLIENNNRDIGSLAIYKDGKEVYYRNFGQSGIPGIRFDKDTKYQIGSITKTYTAVLLFQLVEQGKLSLDDRLADFFPDMPGATEITIRQMLNHTSGLGDYVYKESDVDWLLKKVSESAILDEIRQQGLLFSPGEQEAYSNSAYFLLARILEQKYKKQYGEILEQYLAGPYGLKHTRSILSRPEHVFSAYMYKDGKWTEKEDFEFINTIGVGDIAASPGDMIRFINELFRYRILKKETVEIMKPILEKNEYFGRGLMQIPMRTAILYGHGGDTRGTHSVLGYNEKDGLSIALAINGQRYNRNAVLLGVLSIIYGEKFDFPVFKDINISDADMASYTGTYSSPELPMKIMISEASGSIIAQATGEGQGAFPLEASARHQFTFEKAGIKMEFRPAEKKLIFCQGDMKFEMTKE